MTQNTRGDTAIEIEIDGNSIRLEGSEEFIDRWAEKAIFSLSSQGEIGIQVGQMAESSVGQNTKSRQAGLHDENDSELDPMAKAAEGLGVDVDLLKKYFDYEKGEVHVVSNEIDQRFALIGTALIRREVDGEESHPNRELKVSLKEDGFDVSDWGSRFLHQLRRDNWAKHDPETDKARNKPFIITDKGEQKFTKWLTNTSTGVDEYL